MDKHVHKYVEVKRKVASWYKLIYCIGGTHKCGYHKSLYYGISWAVSECNFEFLAQFTNKKWWVFIEVEEYEDVTSTSSPTNQHWESCTTPIDLLALVNISLAAQIRVPAYASIVWLCVAQVQISMVGYGFFASKHLNLWSQFEIPFLISLVSLVSKPIVVWDTIGSMISSFYCHKSLVDYPITWLSFSK